MCIYVCVYSSANFPTSLIRLPRNMHEDNRWMFALSLTINLRSSLSYIAMIFISFEEGEISCEIAWNFSGNIEEGGGL